MNLCVLLQGLFAEYIELLVQFGYLSLFSCVYPLTAVLLLINNLTEIRSDAYKICRLFRKPFCPPVANMGVWQVSRENTTHNRNEIHPVCHTHTVVSLSCVSDRFRSPEFRLCRVQLLAAAPVSTVTAAVSGGGDEQQRHPIVGCFGRGKMEDGEVTEKQMCVSSLNIFSCYSCACSMCSSW